MIQKHHSHPRDAAMLRLNSGDLYAGKLCLPSLLDSRRLALLRRAAGMTVFVLFLSLSPGQAQAQINQAMCSYLPSNSGAHLAGANYVPGVDVRGNAVVPADVNAQVPGSVDVIRFPVTVDMAQQLTQTLTQGTEMQAPVMMVEIHTGGGVMIDGVDVTNNAYRLCGKVPPAITEAKMPEPVPPENTEPAAGQKEEIIWGEGY